MRLVILIAHMLVNVGTMNTEKNIGRLLVDAMEAIRESANKSADKIYYDVVPAYKRDELREKNKLIHYGGYDA